MTMKKSFRIVLAGNPNCGKTTIFNQLTGTRQHVGNYPGVTVERKVGGFSLEGCRVEIVDLPGIYSLSSSSPEEKVAFRELMSPGIDLILNVVDSSIPQRSLYLTTQLTELGIPMLIVFNMMDEAREKGLEFQFRNIEKCFGAEIVQTVGSRGGGMDHLRERIRNALLSGQAPPSFPVETPLENGVTKHIRHGEDGFYVLDFWIPSGWEDGVWLRGDMKSRDSSQIVESIFKIFSMILPVFILSAAAGGYLIVRKAMLPIARITETASRISEGRDLSSRIGLPPGKDEVSRLSNAFDHMFARLEQSFEAEKQFTSDASHELRTPTSVILAQCSYARKHADSLDEYQEAIDVIDRQAQKMSLLISRLLDMTRLDLGTQKLKKEATDFSEMLRVICEEQDTRARDISLHTAIQEHVIVYADPFLLSRVVANLLENARKYGKEHGKIELRLSVSGSHAVLEVEDDGIGIPPEHLPHIWQRFYQVNPSREAGTGLGLGLSMVRQILLLHEGSITVRSTPGSGSCFTVRLPCDSGQLS